MHFSNLLLNKRLSAIFILGFISGLPLALTGSTLQAWLTESKVDLLTIGALSLLGLPYTFKLIWAPLMDHFSFPQLGRRKGWMIAMQIGLCIALFILANLDPQLNMKWVCLTALGVAFFSASQDISITAYQTDLLSAEERGLGAAYYVFAYRIALLFSGGLALVLADHIGWKLTYELMAMLVVVAIFLTYRMPNVVEYTTHHRDLLQTTLDAFRNIWQRENVIFLLFFILFYKLGDALALSLMTNFLLHGLGFTLTEIGLVYKTMSFIGVILGGFLGGLILSRWNIYKALLVFGLAQAFSTLLFVVLSVVGKNFFWMMTAVFVENFCSGLSTAALLAFLMSLCDYRFTATQYAVFSAIASIGRVFLGPLAAWMVSHLGWMQFFVWSFGLCFPGLLILMLLKERVLVYESAIAK